MDGKVPVFLDGGVRLGSDVFKALAIGATAVFIGRPVLWGLAYDGQAGVEKVLEILRDEFVRTMRLTGRSFAKTVHEPYIGMSFSYAFCCRL